MWNTRRDKNATKSNNQKLDASHRYYMMFTDKYNVSPPITKLLGFFLVYLRSLHKIL
jgi:hypothetical protein